MSDAISRGLGTNGDALAAESTPPVAPKSDRKRILAARFRWVPLSPLVAALCLGIVVDRYSEPLETRTWVEMILGCGVVATLTC